MTEERTERKRESQDNRESDRRDFGDRERRWNDSSAAVVLRETNLEKVDEKRRRHADEQMLEIEERGEKERGLDVAPLEDAREGEQKNAEKKAVVLEMNVIDEKEAEVGEQQEGDDHLSVLQSRNAIRRGGGGRVRAGAGQQLHESRLRPLFTRIDEKKISCDDRKALKNDGSVGGVVEVFDNNHSRIHQDRHLGKKKLEVSEERRIVQCPFRC